MNGLIGVLPLRGLLRHNTIVKGTQFKSSDRMQEEPCSRRCSVLFALAAMETRDAVSVYRPEEFIGLRHRPGGLNTNEVPKHTFINGEHPPNNPLYTDDTPAPQDYDAPEDEAFVRVELDGQAVNVSTALYAGYWYDLLCRVAAEGWDLAAHVVTGGAVGAGVGLAAVGIGALGCLAVGAALPTLPVVGVVVVGTTAVGMLLGGMVYLWKKITGTDADEEAQVGDDEVPAPNAQSPRPPTEFPDVPSVPSPSAVKAQMGAILAAAPAERRAAIAENLRLQNEAMCAEVRRFLGDFDFSLPNLP